MVDNKPLPKATTTSLRRLLSQQMITQALFQRRERRLRLFKGRIQLECFFHVDVCFNKVVASFTGRCVRAPYCNRYGSFP